MAEPEYDDPEAARTRLLELLEDDDWELSESARQKGKAALRWLHDREPMDGELVEYVISRLRGGTTLRYAPQGDPPGSTGAAWQMTDCKAIFIKLRICERRIGQEYAYIQSIHESIHPQ